MAMNPTEALEQIVAGAASRAPSSPLDYSDDESIAVALTVPAPSPTGGESEGWVVYLRRRPG